MGWHLVHQPVWQLWRSSWDGTDLLDAFCWNVSFRAAFVLVGSVLMFRRSSSWVVKPVQCTVGKVYIYLLVSCMYFGCI